MARTLDAFTQSLNVPLPPMPPIAATATAEIPTDRTTTAPAIMAIDLNPRFISVLRIIPPPSDMVRKLRTHLPVASFGKRPDRRSARGHPRGTHGQVNGPWLSRCTAPGTRQSVALFEREFRGRSAVGGMCRIGVSRVGGALHEPM